MSIAPAVKPASTHMKKNSGPTRQWLARLNLQFAKRSDKTALAGVEHLGPLRVQRPFYPEGPECCHVYLLHPPGGMVVGDELDVQLHLEAGCHSLVTTPSAGKLYQVPGGGERQLQRVTITAKAQSRIEWLPQETLIFDGANGELHTQIHLHGDAQLFAWDIVCLGRPASNLPFNNGHCVQHIEVKQDEQLVFFEKNRFDPTSELMHAPWGLNNCHTSGTLLATVAPERTEVDDLLSSLSAELGEQCWGLTQKQNLFIARYRGNSALACRKGFEILWRALRPRWGGKGACVPRIWFT